MRPPLSHPHGYFCSLADWREGILRPIEPGKPIVHCALCDDGTRDIILERPIIYVDPEGHVTVVPIGFRANGLSNPVRLAWGICNPYEPLTRDASVVHDWDCDNGILWSKAAWRFYHAMLAAFIHGGKFEKRGDRLRNRISRACRIAICYVRAYLRWFAVRWFGVLFAWRHR